MAVVMPPLDIRPGSRGSGSGLGQTAVAAPGYSHLTFDSARGAPGERTADRERLRERLVDVGTRFVGFDRVIEDDTVKRRQQEVHKLKKVQEDLVKLERALNSEIKRRVDANKQVQGLTETLANDMLERLQRTIRSRIEKLAASIESLTFRCVALEKGISQFRGELPSKLAVDTAALVKEISGLRRQMDGDREQRVQRDTSLLRRIAEMEGAEATQFDEGADSIQKTCEQLKSEIDGLARTEEVSSGQTEKFRSFILEEIAGMKNVLVVSAQAREQTDDEIVQAMNQYTNALQKGLHSANNR